MRESGRKGEGEKDIQRDSRHDERLVLRPCAGSNVRRCQLVFKNTHGQPCHCYGRAFSNAKQSLESQTGARPISSSKARSGPVLGTVLAASQDAGCSASHLRHDL